MTLNDFNHYKADIKGSRHEINIYEPQKKKLIKQYDILINLRNLSLKIHPPRIFDLFNVLSAYSVEREPEFPFADLALEGSTLNFVKASAEKGKPTTRKAANAASQQPPALLLFETAEPDSPIGIGIRFKGKVTYLICHLAGQPTPSAEMPLGFSIESMLIRGLSPESASFD